MPKEIDLTVCLDVDGVLAHYDHWKGPHFGPPIDEGVKLARMLKGAGYKIVIQTSRLHPQWGPEGFETMFERLRGWLATWKIPYDYIDVSGKAIAHAYVDDRAVHFPRNVGKAKKVFKVIEERAREVAQCTDTNVPTR